MRLSSSFSARGRQGTKVIDDVNDDEGEKGGTMRHSLIIINKGNLDRKERMRNHLDNQKQRRRGERPLFLYLCVRACVCVREETKKTQVSSVMCLHVRMCECAGAKEGSVALSSSSLSSATK